MYYLQSRYYNPDWGRFINADAIAGSVGELLSHNVFSYCSNNPITRSDPSGFMWRMASDECGATANANATMSIPADELSGVKDGGLAAKANGGAHTVKDGTQAHKGEMRIWKPGASDKYVSKAAYVSESIVDSVKSTFTANALINVAISGVSNALSAHSFKEFAFGTTVDTLSGIVIGAASIGIVTGAVALFSISAPAAVVGVATVGVAYGLTKATSGLVSGAKEYLNSTF